MSDDDQRKPDWDAYDKYLDALESRESSNTEAYDKAILTLSSAGLALSMVILKLFSSGVEPQFIAAIISSWILFFIAIFTTVLSFLVANLEIEVSEGLAKDLYIDRVTRDKLKKNKWSKRLEILTWTSGPAFILALLSVIFFAVGNVGSIKQDNLILDNKTLTERAVLLGRGSLSISDVKPILEGKRSINLI
ncbi:MAG: hypothetical protein JKY50_22160 [Oleispira sp.]|nr:hypothetical protein [Oleispira sp.]